MEIGLEEVDKKIIDAIKQNVEVFVVHMQCMCGEPSHHLDVVCPSRQLQLDAPCNLLLHLRPHGLSGSPSGGLEVAN